MLNDIELIGPIISLVINRETAEVNVEIPNFLFANLRTQAVESVVKCEKGEGCLHWHH